MPRYTVDVPIWATLTVEADSLEAAGKALARVNGYNVVLFPDIDPEDEITLSEDATLWTVPPDATFGQVDALAEVDLCHYYRCGTCDRTWHDLGEGEPMDCEGCGTEATPYDSEPA